MYIGGQRLDGLRKQLHALQIELGNETPDLHRGLDWTRHDYWVDEFLGFPVQAYSHIWATGRFESYFSADDPEHLEAIEAAVARAPELTERYNAVRERRDRLTAMTQDARSKKVLESRLVEVFHKLERSLAEAPYLAGEQLSLADIVWVTFLAHLEYLERPIRDFEPHLPHLERWYEQIKNRPDYEAAGVWDRPRNDRLIRQFYDANRLALMIAVLLATIALLSMLSLLVLV